MRVKRGLLLWLSALLLLGCTQQAPPATPQTGPNGGPTPLPPVRADNRIIADGRVVPVRRADLSFPAGGIVGEVLVSEGDEVEAGQLLVRLNDARQRAAIAIAEADVRRAKARLAEVQAGSREQEIAAAQATLDAAQARLDSLSTEPRPEEVSAAQAELAAARAALEQALSGPSKERIAAAAAELANAQAARSLAQAAYDKVASAPDIGSRPESLNLERATNDYLAAKARYDELNTGANPAEVASAQAQVQRAQANLDQVRAPARPADVAAAEAEVRRAQAQLDLLLAGAQPEQIEAADADVAAAEAALAQANVGLAETELRAPFSGVVAGVEVVVGQQALPGALAVRLGDFSSWLVETRDLTELNIVGVQPGDRAVLTFDAIPGLTVSGQVLRIRSIGENTQGDITYTVVVSPDRSDDRLKWNMTAKVTVEPGSAPP